MTSCPAERKTDAPKTVAPAAAPAAGLTFTERHRLDELPDRIERLEAEIAKLGELLADPTLYAREPVKFRKATEALAQRESLLAEAENEWLLLEQKAAGA